jgi:hypothetical protein
MPVSMVAGVPFAVCYPVIAWMCWLPNLAFAEWLVRRKRTPAQVLLHS